MRNVWRVSVVVSCLWIASSPISAAMLQQTPAAGGDPRPAPDLSKDQVGGEILFVSDFVYQPTPTPLADPDGKFHREGFRVRTGAAVLDFVNAATHAGSTAPSPPAPTPTPWDTQVLSTTVYPVQPSPATSLAPAIPVTPGTRLTLSSDQKVLFHETRYDFKSAATPTPMPVMATATPFPTPDLVAQPTAVIIGTIEAALDIEDPRFYRGSFTIVPPSAAPASAVPNDASAESPAPAPGYGGDSAATLSPAYSERTPLPLSGKAMYYNPGIMQEVYTYRLRLGQIQACGDCVGYAALLRQGDLNRRVWLQWDSGTVEGPFLVIDVAARHHIALLLSRDWVVDVDYTTAMRRRMAGPVPVTVLSGPQWK